MRRHSCVAYLLPSMCVPSDLKNRAKKFISIVPKYFSKILIIESFRVWLCWPKRAREMQDNAFDAFSNVEAFLYSLQIEIKVQVPLLFLLYGLCFILTYIDKLCIKLFWYWEVAPSVPYRFCLNIAGSLHRFLPACGCQYKLISSFKKLSFLYYNETLFRTYGRFDYGNFLATDPGSLNYSFTSSTCSSFPT